jgi:hypothetical protein
MLGKASPENERVDEIDRPQDGENEADGQHPTAERNA